MDTARGRPSLLWLRRLVVVAGFAVGGWLLGAAPAGAEDLTDLANNLIDRAADGEGITALVDEAFADPLVQPLAAPADGANDDTDNSTDAPDPRPAPAEPEQTSSAAGSTSSVRGVERENTTTFGGVDYGPGPTSGWAGSTANRVEPVAAPARVVAPATAPRRSGIPPPATPAPVRPVAEAPAPAPAPAAPVTRSGGDRTAPAERPVDLPTPPPAPSAPGSGTSAGSAHDGGGQARGALGVLATRDHATAPDGGWPMAFPQVHGAAVAAAGTPGSRPD